MFYLPGRLHIIEQFIASSLCFEFRKVLMMKPLPIITKEGTLETVERHYTKKDVFIKCS